MQSKTIRLLLSALTAAAAALLLYLLSPPCIILESTGLYCVACGTHRMLSDILAGNIYDGLRHNPYMFFTLPITILWLLAEGVRYIAGKTPLFKKKPVLAVFIAVIAAGILFMVLRNIPGFSMLLPV